MPKGFIRLMAVATLLTASSIVHAQVYRCEGAAGVTFSDMPCGEGSEEIEVQGDVMNSHGVGSSGVPGLPVTPSQPGNSSGSGATQQEQPEETQKQRERRILREFMRTLETQRAEQMAELNRQIKVLRNIKESAEYASMPEVEQENIDKGLSMLRAQKSDLQAQYAAMIAEANSRLE